MGANDAAGSAAVFTNVIYEHLKVKPEGFNRNNIEEIFTQFQSKRLEHVEVVFNASHETTRTEAMDGLKYYLMGRYVFPILGENMKLHLMKTILVRAPTLSFIDNPIQPHTVPYLDEKQSSGGWLSWIGF
jgi:hypothetical protein